MGFGSRLEATRRLPAGLRRERSVLLRLGRSIFALAVICFFVACGGGGDSFPSALARLDAALLPGASSSAREKAFREATRRANSSSEWLAVLKRASRLLPNESGAVREVAARAVSTMPASEPVQTAAAWILLRVGAAEEALALFEGGHLSRAKRPDLWAEAFVRAMQGGKRAATLEDSASWDALARIVGDPRLLALAAAFALKEGDGFVARATLSAALDQGADPPDELLWDAGLVAVLAARSDEGANATRLRLLGDAAWLSGDRLLAERRWERARMRDPRGSWKTLASLATARELAAGEVGLARSPRLEAPTDAMRPPFSYSGEPPAIRRAEQASPEPPRAALFDAELLSIFPDSSAARCTVAARLLRNGKSSEALSLLASRRDAADADVQTKILILEAGARLWPEDRLVAESLRLAAAHPDEGTAVEVALRMLFTRKRYVDFLTLADGAQRRGLEYAGRWFYAAAAMALHGDFRAAATILEREGAAQPGPLAPFALGLAYQELGDYRRALDRLEVALSLAPSGGARAAVLKEIGRTRVFLGELDGARAAFLAAALADPADTEAPIFARDPVRARGK